MPDLYCSLCGGLISEPCKHFAGPFKAFFMEQKENEMKVDPVIEAVRKDLYDRSQLGVKKYGTTLEENICTHRAKLQHAYEEALDLANYLKWSIMKIDAQNIFSEEEKQLGRDVAQALKAK